MWQVQELVEMKQALSCIWGALSGSLAASAWKQDLPWGLGLLSFVFCLLSFVFSHNEIPKALCLRWECAPNPKGKDQMRCVKSDR